MNSIDLTTTLAARTFFLMSDGGTGNFLTITIFFKIFKFKFLGKSFLYNTMIATCRSKNYTVLVCASTGIASILLEGTSGTAHKTFRIPNNVTKEMTTRFSYEEYEAALLRESKLIIVDEVSMLHRNIIDAIDKTLRFNKIFSLKIH